MTVLVSYPLSSALPTELPTRRRYSQTASGFGGCFPKVSEQEKREHVIKLNLARRHLDGLRWGQAFELLLEFRGVVRGKGKYQQEQTDTMSVCEVAEEVGVDERTAYRRLAEARDYKGFTPAEKAQVDSGAETVKSTKRKRKERKKQAVERPETAPRP